MNDDQMARPESRIQKNELMHILDDMILYAILDAMIDVDKTV